MSTLYFEDAVTAGNLDPKQKNAVYYADGMFANRVPVADHCRDAKLYAITVRGLTGHLVFACDCEKGDLTPAQAEAWVAEQVRLNVELICVYANLSTWQSGLQAVLAKYGHRIKRWVAHYDGVNKVPGGFDCKQYATGLVDRNVALGTFFQGTLPKPDVPHGTAHFEGSVNVGTGKVESIRGLPGLGVHFTGPERYLDVALQLAVGKDGGHWRAKP
jgi:hypothetical protein